MCPLVKSFRRLTLRFGVFFRDSVSGLINIENIFPVEQVLTFHYRFTLCFTKSQFVRWLPFKIEETLIIFKVDRAGVFIVSLSKLLKLKTWLPLVFLPPSILVITNITLAVVKHQFIKNYIYIIMKKYIQVVQNYMCNFNRIV